MRPVPTWISGRGIGELSKSRRRMESSSTVWISRAAVILLVALFAVNVYRAATQSITADEAVTFVRWVRPPLRDLIPQPYDPNNHVLNSVLVKRSVGLFRLSE